MNRRLTPNGAVRGLILVGWLLATHLPLYAASTIVLEGQNKGDTNNWYAGNLQNWLELDYIPCRVHFQGAQGNNRAITVYFEHLNNGNPGIQNLFAFSCSSNIVFTSPPVLSAPTGANTWSYSFTANVLDNQAAYVWFQSRLAAGAHLNVGSSLALSGNPSSMGNLQIHKPAPAKGSPDLVVVKSGPAMARPGDVITYTLTYSNKLSAPNYATGVQLTDFLPDTVTVLTNTVPGNGLLLGSSMYWDLLNLVPGDAGQISFQVVVNPGTPYNSTFTNSSQILSAENDANYSDNYSSLVSRTVGCAPPSIAICPVSATKCPGDAITFTGQADGTSPLSFQWRKDGSNIPGATASSYTIPTIGRQDAGLYSVAVTNLCGFAISPDATLTVSTNVTATPLESHTVCPGDAATFSTIASGTGPFTFVWRKDGILLPETNDTLVVNAATVADAGTYSVEVSGACGSTVSNIAVLALNQNPLISSPPADVTTCAGLPASFTFAATGTELHYQWYKASSPLAGATSSSLILASVSPADAGLYSVAVTGTCGAAFTNNAILTVYQNVIVTTPPGGLTNCPGTPATFSITATGTGLNYQWFKNGTLLPGQTNSLLQIANVTLADGGTYRAVVSGICGSAVTNDAFLAVNAPAEVVSPLTDQTNCAGGSVTFNVVGSGTGLSYHWYRNNNPLLITYDGQTQSSLTLNNLSPADAGIYSVVLIGICGDAVTNSARLVVNTPVTIANPPTDLALCPGDEATFSISATGSELAYQWYKGANLLPGQTAAALNLASVSAADAGTYSVVVSATCGNAITNSATLTVNQNVVVATTPLSLTNCPGTPASFSVNASGTGLAYQWFKDGSLLPGQTASILNLASVSSPDAGTYSVVVSGTCGNSLTNSATLTLNQNVVIATAPLSITNCPGTLANFSVIATGAGLAYQWYKGTDLLPGQTAAALNVTAVSSADAGSYSVVVSGTCGNTVTNSATLTVNQNVVVATAPLSLTNCPGKPASFSVNATGTGLSYQWYKGANPLPGQTAFALNLASVSAADAGTYSVVVSGTCGNSLTNSATLTVNQNVVVATAPLSLTNCPGTPASFSVSATGTDLSYQWYKGANLLPGQTAFALNLAAVSSADAGTYSVVVSGTCGNSLTNSATLTVNQNVVVATAPLSLTNCPGTPASFSVSATGTDLSYQWYKGANLLPGQTAFALNLAAVSSADAGTYSVVVSGTCGNAVTNSATLTVNQNVVVTTAPLSLTNCPGTPASFSVSATGTDLSYQWYKGANLLPGQTASALNLASVSSADAGTYSVVVSGTCGNAVTNSATLTVNQDVVVATAPLSLTNCPGTPASFSVNASGTGLNYQWYKDGGLLQGETNNTFTLASVRSRDAATYSVVVSGSCGNSVTKSATLTVYRTVTITSSPVSMTNCFGTTASFNTAAIGAGLVYQWFKDDIAIPGQTASSLSLAAITAADAGTYSVVVSGTAGNSVTNSATLTLNQNVVIATAPLSLTNCPGTPANFNVNATGTGLVYQWYKGTNLLPGQTASFLNLASVSSADAGAYSVVVSGTCGNSVTNSATLTVNQNVVVATAPLSLTNCPGTPASFSVNATGTGLAYQWYKGTNLLPGQTASALNLASVSSADAGTYSVVVSGTCGNSVTNSATLTLNQNVVIATAPLSLTNCPGTPANFSVNATGTGLVYQWYKGTNLLPGQTASFLNLASVSSADAGAYSVVVSGTCGNSVTNSATLTVNQNVVVATAPLSITNCPGTPASFSVNATGTGLAYQWYKGTNLLPGQTASALNLTSVSSADAGTYSVVVSGTCGNSVTNSATLTLNQNVVIATAPLSLTNCPGTPASFSVNATGTGLAYQWYKGTNLLPGQTASFLNLASVSSADAGAYSVVVSGTCGNSVTNSATLTVNQNVVVATAPLSITNCPGTPASFSVNATGTGLAYQWYKGTNLLPGQTASALNLTSVSSADAGTYSVVVSGTCGNSVTNSATLTLNQDVVIATAPLSLTNCPGTPASFSVNATGTGLVYQWYKGANLLPGQTASALNLASVSSADAGTYSVVVSGTCGNSVTNSATLTVKQNVVVATAPLSLTNCPGTPATFNVNATGTGLAYQWYNGTNLLPGQTSSFLNLASVSSADAGSYSVVVSGTCGNSVTNSATLTLNQNVVIATAPLSLTNCPGTPASFSVNATGTGLAYQWYKGTNLLPGQTASALNLASVSSADAGSYSVVVSGTCGNSVTNSATLTLNQNVVIATAPLSLTNCPGTPASFSVNATGTGLAYQWYKGTNLLPGQTSSFLNLASVTSADAGAYSVVVSGTCGNSVTNSATLTLNQNVVIATAPLSLTNCPGTPANFNVIATGTGLLYQWYKGANLLPGQTSSFLNLASVSSADAGTYSVVVSGTCGNSVTNSATLTLNQDVVIATAPLSLTNCPGTPASFSVNATGTGLAYQWYKGTNLLPGQTASALNLASVSTADAGAYSVVVSGTCGNSVTNSATLTLNQNVVIATAPLSLTNCPGTPASFSVNATGTGLAYQWYKGTNLLPGQTASALNLASVSTADAGAYSVVVSGTCGNSVTNSATLTLNQNVVIATAPLSLTNCPGTPASFSVNATGTGLAYQWYKGTNLLPGQTSSFLNLASVSSADAGSYSVVVSGTCGNSVTNSATLTLNQNVVIATAPLSLTNCPGTPASFSVNATGTGLAYQWYKGTNLLPGQTAPALNLASVSTADAGAYSVVVSGTCGNSVTNSATLTLNQNVVIATAPLSLTNCPGTPANFNVIATGTGLAYQWYNGTNLLPGQTSSFLNLASVSSADAGSYSVVVSGTCGNSVTNSATLTLNQNVVIATAPLSITNCPGTPANFSVNATGTGLAYQWYKGTNLLPGQTASALNLASVSTADAGAYSVVVSGTCGNSVTNSATLTLNQDVVIATAPLSLTNCPGTPASFSVNATGTGLAYQWYKGTNLLPGQTASALNLASVSSADAGAYSVVVSGTCGNSVTNSATLTLNQNVVIATAPLSLTNCPGTPASFSVNATGTGLAYQWYKGTNLLPGQTASALNLASVSTADAGAYSVVVSGTCGNSVTNSATLTLNQNVVIATAPLSITNCPGTPASFSVNATGTGLAYQWYKGTNLLPGQTSSFLNLASVSTADAGTYSVVVSGTCGNSVTNSATLTVKQNVVVATAPLSLTNCPGTPATFNVNATGTGLAYQWYNGTNLLPGQTSSFLNLASVSSADAGSYSVVVSGTCGNSVTNSATLTLNQNVVIATAPLSLTNCPGTPASFSVNATGTGLAYQWYKGTNLLPGQTASALNLASVSSADAGSYSVVVSGTCGNSVTNSATLTLNQNVVIATAPLSITNCPGTPANFNVNATGTGLAYQWYKGTNLLPGQTSSFLNLASVTSADAGAYSVVVSGTCGNSVTNSATLTLNQNVVIATAPLSLTNCPGTPANFNVIATGTGLLYQWYKGANLLPGQTSSFLNLASVSSADAGTYSVVVSGTCGNSVTNSATLTLNQDVVIATAPLSLTNCPGTPASFSVNATGTGLAYQWYKGTNLLPGQTASALNLASVSSADAGAYSVVVSGTCGNSVTNSATLTLNQDVVIATAPLSLTNCPGTPASFSVNATGTGLAYQWYKGTNLLPGQTAPALNLASVSTADAGSYSVVVSGTCGNSVTNSATLTLNQDVVIATAPLSLTNCPGTPASFSVNATGTGLAYQWYKGTNLLPGQTSSFLNLASVSSADAGSYSVVVSGTCGNSVTNSATLTLNQNVVIATAPLSLTNCPGTPASFSVNATGTGLAYQWYKGTNLLPGQTAPALNLASVSTADAGAYSVVVSGTCGNSVTNSATLTLNQNVVIATAPLSLTNCPGTPANFNVIATGTGLAYQWYNGTNLLPGQTSSFLNLASVSSADAGSYSVVVSGTCGNSVTNSATLTLNQNVVIATAPLSITNCPGTPANFSVNATGTGLAYQWYKGTNLLPGQTASALNLASVSSADAGAYSVVVSGTCGNSVTNSATLTLNQNVVIATAPLSITNCPGTPANFNVNATGTGLAYQWYKGTNLLPGQTASALNLASVSTADAGAYSVVVSGTCGNSVTNSATLTVNQNVVVATAPLSITNCPGTPASFNVIATGTGLAYQWYKGANLLPGQTASALNLASVSTADAGAYSVVVSGTCGNSVTNSATLTVNQNVVVATAPLSITNCPGTPASFNVIATGTGLAYQWYKGANLLPGQTASALNLASVSTADAGAYSVVVSGTCGNSVTNSATLTVNQNVVIATAPLSITNCPGTPANFSVNATGTGLTYQWYKGTNPLPGQTASFLNLASVSSADAGTYSVVVNGTCGNFVTNSAMLSVNPSTVASPLANALKNLGASVTFSTMATGTSPLSYVWKKNGNAIADASSSSLTLTNLAYSDEAVYSVEVTGGCNTAVQAATLTINRPPTVTLLSPTNGQVFIAPANFTVLADAQDIDGYVTNVDFFSAATNKLGFATNAPYFVVLTNVSAGTYTFLADATDNLGAMGTSAPVTITVLAQPPLSIVSSLQFNPQTGLFEQTVRVFNPTYSSLDAVRVYVGNLTNNAKLWNASGTSDGVAYVESYAAVASGSYVDFVLEYYVPSRIAPNPTLSAQLVPPPQGGTVAVSGAGIHIDRGLMLPNRTFLLEFATVSNRVYYVQYTGDLQKWQTAQPAITGNGTKIQWIDNGQPKTDNPPAANRMRLYRVVVLP